MADIRYLQEYLREKDHSAQVKDYFLKLTEEVGELGRAIRMDLPHSVGEDIKGTIDEEIWDVIYYALVIANCYGIDMEQAIRLKEAYNKQRFHSSVAYDPPER